VLGADGLPAGHDVQAADLQLGARTTRSVHGIWPFGRTVGRDRVGVSRVLPVCDILARPLAVAMAGQSQGHGERFLPDRTPMIPSLARGGDRHGLSMGRR
jgi:hypothetical protein